MNKRKHDRFDTTKEDDIVVTVHRKNSIEGQPDTAIAATIDDLSQSGIRIRTTDPMNFHEKVVLEVENKRGSCFVAKAEIRHIQPDLRGDGGWISGCILSELLPDDLLDALARIGLVNRRRYDRKEVKLPAKVKVEMNSDEIKVDVIDLSRNGISFRCDQEIQVGSKIQIGFWGRAKLLSFCLRACRCTQTEEGWIVGCSPLKGDLNELFASLDRPVTVPPVAVNGFILVAGSLMITLILRYSLLGIGWW